MQLHPPLSPLWPGAVPHLHSAEARVENAHIKVTLVAETQLHAGHACSAAGVVTVAATPSITAAACGIAGLPDKPISTITAGVIIPVAV